MKKIISIILILIFSLSMSACDGGSSDSSSIASSDESASVVESSSEPFVKKDLVADVHLSDSFVGKTYVSDGIGEVTLEDSYDGDTILVKENGLTLTIRFLAVDTKESTGTVQPWGHAASVFTKSKVENATSIVLESDDGNAAVTESNGRYLGWVWYLPEGETEYRNLNLELVQESYSQPKGASDSKYASEMTDIFAQALQENIRLNNNNMLDPDFYYGDAIQVTLEEFRNNPSDYYDTSTGVGKKIRFEATVSKEDGYSIYVESTGTDGLQYGISIFTSYKNYPVLSMGNTVIITGTVSEHLGAYQLVSVSYDEYDPDEDDMKLVNEGPRLEATLITADELDTSVEANIHLESTFVKLENVVIDSVYQTTEGSQVGYFTLTGHVDDVTVSIRLKALKKSDGSYANADDYAKGTVMTVEGLVERYDSNFQIKVISFKNITFI